MFGLVFLNLNTKLKILHKSCKEILTNSVHMKLLVLSFGSIKQRLHSQGHSSVVPSNPMLTVLDVCFLPKGFSAHTNSASMLPVRHIHSLCTALKNNSGNSIITISVVVPLSGTFSLMWTWVSDFPPWLWVLETQSGCLGTGAIPSAKRL